MPALERKIADIAWEIAEKGVNPEPDPESCLPDRMIHAERGHRSTLAKRLENMAQSLKVDVEKSNWSEILGVKQFLLDSSGGAASSWFAAGLNRRGIPTKEISNEENPLNEGCGAGEFSPTAS